MDRGKETQKEYLLMPDSFKGTMDAIEVCQIMKRSILEHDRDARVISVPIADGGEGTVDCFIHAFGGEKIPVQVTGPYGEPVAAFYNKCGNTAVVEMAAACGLSLIDKEKSDPSAATTYGVGELIQKAIEDGNKKIILGLGGSCTNDGGAGMAAALGAKFYNKQGEPFVPTGNSLWKIREIDTTEIDAYLEGISIEAMCDIDNPLYGPDGAACVFAPQKGADPDLVMILDYNLKSYAKRLKDKLGVDVANLAGGGAAGGMGAGAYVFLKAELKQGIDVILDLLDFENLLKNCQMIFTGEGKLDQQSLGGKAVIGISRRAKKAGVPVIAVVGRVEGDISGVYEEGITGVFQTNPDTYENEAELRRHCKEDLAAAMERVFRSSQVLNKEN